MRRRVLHALACGALLAGIGAAAGADAVSQTRPDPLLPTQPRAAYVSPDWARAAIRFPAIADTRGSIDGRGMRVGLIDSGVELRHPLLRHARVAAWRDFIDGSPAPVDSNGHGTAIASVLVGQLDARTLFGVAPGADLIVARAIDAQGLGAQERLVSALRWMADPDGDPATDDAPEVVNCSWALYSESAPVEAAVRDLERAGVLVVFAAGNAGPGPGTMSVIAQSPGAIAVSATAPDGGMLSMSSRGDARSGYPDLAAPGAAVLGAGPGRVTGFDGTSIAAPFVTGTALLVRQLKPGWSPREVREWLTSTATDMGPAGPDADTGAGQLNMDAALSPLLAADPVRPRIVDLRVPRRAVTRMLSIRTVTTPGAYVRVMRPRDGAWIGPFPAGRVTIPVSWRGEGTLRVQAVSADGTPEGVVHVAPVRAVLKEGAGPLR